MNTFDATGLTYEQAQRVHSYAVKLSDLRALEELKLCRQYIRDYGVEEGANHIMGCLNALEAQLKGRYALVSFDEGTIESPFFDTKQEVADWLKPEVVGVGDFSGYDIQLFSAEDAKRIDEGPEV